MSQFASQLTVREPDDLESTAVLGPPCSLSHLCLGISNNFAEGAAITKGVEDVAQSTADDALNQLCLITCLQQMLESADDGQACTYRALHNVTQHAKSLSMSTCP